MRILSVGLGAIILLQRNTRLNIRKESTKVGRMSKLDMSTLINVNKLNITVPKDVIEVKDMESFNKIYHMNGFNMVYNLEGDYYLIGSEVVYILRKKK